MELLHGYSLETGPYPDSFFFMNNLYIEYSGDIPASPVVEDKRRYNLQYKGTFKYDETRGYSLWYPNYWMHAVNIKTEYPQIETAQGLRRIQGIMLNNSPFIMPEQMIGIAIRPIVITGVELTNGTVSNWGPTDKTNLIANKIFKHKYSRTLPIVSENPGLTMYDVTGINGDILEKPYFSAAEPDWHKILCDISGEYVVNVSDIARVMCTHSDEGGSLFPGDWMLNASGVSTFSPQGPINTKQSFQNPDVPETIVNRFQLFTTGEILSDPDLRFNMYKENNQIYAVQYSSIPGAYISAIDKTLGGEFYTNVAGTPKCGMLHIVLHTNHAGVGNILKGVMVRFCRTERLI